MILLLGTLAMWKLPISEYPEVVPPTIAINAAYPGASPETIASTVAGPLEQQMTGLDGMLYMFSQSMPDGTMQLTLTFKLGTDLNIMLTEVQNRIQRATPRLPEEVRRLGVVSQKATRNLLMVVHLTSPDSSVNMLDLSNFARLNVRDQLLRIPGISDVPVFGAGEYSMRVWLDPEKMAARNLAPADVVTAIREQNVQIAAGTMAQQPVTTATPFELTITTQGRLTDAEQFAAIIVHRGSNGQLVRLGDVARIELGADKYSLRSLLGMRKDDGTVDPGGLKTATALPIIQAPDSNALDVSNQVRAKMMELKKTFPAGIDYQIVYDPTQFIRASIEAVVHTLLEALVLVVLVVILFLQTWRASLIPLLAVPVSIIGTFAIMLSFGFTINALSLFGLVLAIGIVVDDAIVVVENVERNIALGMLPRAATRQAMREVSGPILATALVLSAVFIPTAFISGLSGRFYQQFALTIAISTVISAFNSLTLSPALAALLLKPHVAGHRPGGWLLGWFFAGFNRVFGAASKGYVGLTSRVVRLSAIALIVYGGLLFTTWTTFKTTPGSFVPPQDKGYLIAFAKLPDGSSLDRSEKVVRQMGEIMLKDPAVEGAVAFPGLSINGFTNAPNAGIVFVRLRDYADRQGPGMDAKSVAGRLQGPMSGINDAFVMVVPPPPILGLGSAGGFKLYLQDRGNVGAKALFDTAQGVMGEARASGKIGFIFSGATLGVPRITVDIDREKVISQGLQLKDVYDALQGYFGTVYANDFNKFGRTYQVNVQADAPFRLTNADLERLKIRNGLGQMVPLASYITIKETAGPDRAMQYNTYPAMDISGDAAPGISGDEAKAAMEVILSHLPPGVGYEWTEITYQQILAGNSAVYVFPVCVLLVFLVLAAFYESLILPLTIVLIVPMCLLCALLGVNLTGGDNNIMTQIGLIVLVGLACKNAILIVEFAREAEIQRKLSPFDAAMEACRLRLRPIIMTSLAFILGVVPLVWAHGAGAELRHATGIAVFSGMIGVTVFGLVLTPVFYVVLRKLFGGTLHQAADNSDQDSTIPAASPTHTST